MGIEVQARKDCDETAAQAGPWTSSLQQHSLYLCRSAGRVYWQLLAGRNL